MHYFWQADAVSSYRAAVAGAGVGQRFLNETYLLKFDSNA